MASVREIAVNAYKRELEKMEEMRKNKIRNEVEWTLKVLKRMFPEVPEEDFNPDYNNGVVEVDGLKFRHFRAYGGKHTLRMEVNCSKCGGKIGWVEIEKVSDIGKFLSEECLCEKCRGVEPKPKDDEEEPNDPVEQIAFWLKRIALAFEEAVINEFFHG